MHLFYYQIKPFLPLTLRTALRRSWVKRKREAYRDVWPINPAAGRRPDVWPGWPEGKKFGLVLTHDVESGKGLQRCRDLMKLDMEMGLRSSFNFVPERYQTPKELRDELTRNGFEIGVHDLRHDGMLYRSRKAFNASAGRINQYLREWGSVGFRSAFMMRNLDWIHELNIQYDASTFDTDPFEPQPLGAATIFPFWVPRVQNSDLPSPLGARPSSFADGYVELPYTLPQDSTLFLLFREKTIETWRTKLDWIAQHGGMCLVIVHPDYMTFNGCRPGAREYHADYYSELLSYVGQKYAGQYWHGLPGELAAYFRKAVESKRVSESKESVSEPRKDVPKPETLGSGAGGNFNGSSSPPSIAQNAGMANSSCFRAKRAAVVLFSHYPGDPRPRRAAEALAREGAIIDVICLRDDQNESSRESSNGINIFRVPVKRRRGGRLAYAVQYFSFLLASFAFLSFRSLTRRYSIVHVHNMPDVLVFSAIIPRALGAKIVLDLHDPMPELMMTIFDLRRDSMSVKLLQQIERWSIRFAHKVLTVNLASRRIFASRSCLPEKIHVIMNSPDEQIFRFRAVESGSNRRQKPDDPFVIMYHGSLVERNGLDLAVDAVAIVRKSIPEVELRIYGQATPFLERVMVSARDRGLHEAIRFFGPKTLEQIVAAIDESHLGIIPNHRNIFTEMNTPTRIFEYLSRGKPVIAPSAQGIRDYFGAEDLVFFELGNAGDLAKKIESVVSNYPQINQLVARGQKIYLAHRWQEEKSRLLEEMAGLLNHKVRKDTGGSVSRSQ